MTVDDISNTKAHLNNRTHREQELTDLQAIEFINSHVMRNNQTISVKPDCPQTLLYQLVMENINTLFFTEFSNPPLETRLDEGYSVEPEALAENIIALITSEYSHFTERHPELSESAALDQFSNIAKEGLNAGISDTKELLDSYNMLEGKLKNSVEQTKKSLFEELNNFNQCFNYDEEVEYGNDPYTDLDSDAILDEELLDRLRM